ncbi:unnamed protein product, partial [Trypanosoma congolense IL3000]
MLRRLFKPRLSVSHWLRLSPCYPSQSPCIVTRDASQAGGACAAEESVSARSFAAPSLVHLNTPIMHRNMFSAPEVKKLLSKAQYSLFTLGCDTSNGDYCIYCATSNELICVKKDTLWKAAFWMEERIKEEYIAGILFPSDDSAELRDAADVVKIKSRKPVVIAPDTWNICYLTLKNQREFVRGMELPTSLEHAAYLLTRSMFSSSVIEPTVFDVSVGTFVSAECADKVSGARDSLVNWWVLFNVHKKFGTLGSRKLMDPVEQIVRRVVRWVNVFVVDINQRVGRGTIAEGFTMIVTIYDAQKRSQSVHTIRSLAEESAKRNTLNGLLFGEGTSSISLFVPTHRTKPSQLLAFARNCRPSCPFFITEMSVLAPHFAGASVDKGFKDEEDPRSAWALTRTNCFARSTGRRSEEVLDRKMLQAFTMVANRLYAERVHRSSPALMSAASKIPLREGAQLAWERVSKLAEEDRVNPVAHVDKLAFLNNVNIHDAEVVFRLQQWHSMIYECPDRLRRETEALQGLRRYLVVDLETTTVRRYKRVSNPFTRDNYVVLSGARDHKGQVFMPSRYYTRNVALRYDDYEVTSTCSLVNGSSKHSLFLPPLDDYDVIVGHNIKFDLLHMWRDAELRRFLKRGGKIWDTMYAEYLLTGHEVKLGCGAGLEEVAKTYGGQKPKLDEVKQAWSMGKDTSEIPYRTLTKYLHGDLENTELIFKKHMERALAQRQVIIIV